MNAPDYLGRRGAPRPPRHIETEMEAAGAAGDTIRLGIAREHDRRWLAEQGIREGVHGATRPDEAIR